MSPTTHALVGALVGRLVRNPGGAFLAGVASHAVLDCLPHTDSAHPLKLLLDAVGVLGVAAVGFAWRDLAAVVGSVGGVLPDIEHLQEKDDPGACAFPSHRFDHDRYPAGLSLGVEILLVAAGLLALAATHPTSGGISHRKTLQDVLK